MNTMQMWEIKTDSGTVFVCNPKKDCFVKSEPDGNACKYHKRLSRYGPLVCGRAK